MQGVKVKSSHKKIYSRKILVPEKNVFKYSNKIVLHYFQPLLPGDCARNRLYASAPKRELEELLGHLGAGAEAVALAEGQCFFLLLYFFQVSVCRCSCDHRQTGSDM